MPPKSAYKPRLILTGQDRLEYTVNLDPKVIGYEGSLAHAEDVQAYLDTLVPTLEPGPASD